MTVGSRVRFADNHATRDMERFAALGARLFPVVEKRPAWPGWQSHASADPETIATMVQVAQAEWLYSGLAVATGTPLVCLDIDHSVGMEAMEGMAAEHGESLIQPDHLMGRTPRGGWHLWCKR